MKEEYLMNKKYILIICTFILLILITTFLVKVNKTKPVNYKENTTQETTTIPNNLTAIKYGKTYNLNNLKITIENNQIYLTLNDNKYELEINNATKMYYINNQKSSIPTIYILTNDGKLYYISSLSTIREYKNEDIQNIKQSINLNNIDKKIINLYQTSDKKIVYEDSNHNYYYLSNNEIYE